MNKLVLARPAAAHKLIADYANLGILNSIGPEEFTPALLAFGAQPRLQIGNYEQQPQTTPNRTDPMIAARRKYEAFIASLQAKRAVNTSAPNELVVNITPGNGVLVNRKKKS